MCGILGVYSTNFSSWEYRAFERLLMINAFRGEDSTGIIRAGIDGRINSRKSMLPSYHFIGSDYSSIIEDVKEFSKPWMIIGHTRHATKGKVNIKNAHPFGFSEVVGMHNGTIHKQFKHRKDYETDSEAFYKNLNEYGLKESLDEIQAYDTAYAFQWVDKKKNTLNFIKNSKRPLHFTYAYSGSTLLWSSDEMHLRMVLKAMQYSTNRGWKMSATDPIFTLDDNHHLTIPIGEDPETKASIEVIDVKKESFTHYSYGYGRDWTESYTTPPVRKESVGNVQGKEDLTYPKGKWVKTPQGYKFHGTKPSLISPPSTSFSEPPNQTSTVKGGTSGKTQGSLTTTTASLTDPSDKERSFRDEYGTKGLEQLDWLDKKTQYPLGDLFDTDIAAANAVEGAVVDLDKERDKRKADKTTKATLKGYAGKQVTEDEFEHHLGNGCFCCGQKLSLKNPHDFASINNIHWWERDLWACNICYETSDGDWVRCSIEDDWKQAK